MAVGSKRYADIAVALTDEPDMVSFNGWQHIGAGSTREVWLGPDGVAYKVTYDDTYQENVGLLEVEIASKLRRKPQLKEQGIFIPQCRLIDGLAREVVAMEYVDGTWTRCESRYGYPCDCRTFGYPRICFTLAHDLLEKYGAVDMFYENVLCDKQDRLWVVDLGCEDS